MIVSKTTIHGALQNQRSQHYIQHTMVTTNIQHNDQSTTSTRLMSTTQQNFLATCKKKLPYTYITISKDIMKMYFFTEYLFSNFNLFSIIVLCVSSSIYCDLCVFTHTLSNSIVNIVCIQKLLITRQNYTTYLCN